MFIVPDGRQHAERQEADQRRTDFLLQPDYRLIRFWNDELVNNRGGVFEVVRLSLER
jgi:very-short-patch-repair endonuclease